jgi:hypothetical protein
MIERISSFQIAVAAEAFAAGLFARCGLDVSVQYGANQPEYDLIVAKAERMLKVSVKGSQDGSWGLTMSHLKEAAITVQSKHGFKGTIEKRSFASFSSRTCQLTECQGSIWLHLRKLRNDYAKPLAVEEI